MKSSKTTTFIVLLFIGLGIFYSLVLNGVRSNDTIFFILFVVVFPFFNSVLPKWGRRLFCIKRQYPLGVFLSVLVISAFLIGSIGEKVPTGDLWLLAVFSFFLCSAIQIFIPIKQIKRNKNP